MVTARGEQSTAPDEEAFPPILVGDEDIEDLSTFFGLSRSACEKRLWSYTVREMADRWNRALPSTPEAITTFYRDADLYIWELMQWHASKSRQPYRATLSDIVRRFPARRGFESVLDFGCGTGGDSLFLAQHGYDVTLMDVDGPAFHFAQHRFARRQMPAQFVQSSWPLSPPSRTYDIAICFDVFEHLPDPVAAARWLVGNIRQGGLLVQQATFGETDRHPCHLASSVARFSGSRWHMWLSGLGLLPLFDRVYWKAPVPVALLQRSRFLVWRRTGVWLTLPRAVRS